MEHSRSRILAAITRAAAAAIIYSRIAAAFPGKPQTEIHSPVAALTSAVDTGIMLVSDSPVCFVSDV